MNEILEKILMHEVHFHFSLSGGHGGQNVNKRHTKAELYFNIEESKYLTPAQKARLIKLGAKRVHHHSSTLIMTDQEERYQEANKEKVIYHFKQLVEQAMIEPKRRIPTVISRSADNARIAEKKIIGKIKKNRQQKKFD